MNRIQRMLVETVARFVPDFRRSVERWNKEAQLGQAALMRLEVERYEQRQEFDRRKFEMMEAYRLAGSGPGMCPVIEGQPVTAHEAAQDVKLMERLWELELTLEDRGWTRQLAIAQMEFSRWGIQQLILISRFYTLTDPLMKRGVYVSSHYVFGRGIEIMSDDEATNEQIQSFIEANKGELGLSGLIEKHKSLQTDGNLFFVFFDDPGSGETRVRMIDPIEIMDVITDPDDSSVPQFYRRNWTPVVFDANSSMGYRADDRRDEWYPALGYEEQIPAAIGGKKVNEQRVFHRKIGGQPKWKFGCPDVYAAIEFSRAYGQYLKDWCTIQRNLARFAYDIEQSGGVQAISAMSQALGTTLGNSASSIEQNPPPTVASSIVHGPGTKIQPVRTANAVTGPEQGRRIMLMVAAAFGLPETFFGDASTGSLATAQSLDRPTELKFLEAQEVWREVLQVIVIYALTSSATSPKGKLREAFGERKVQFVSAREAPRKRNPDKPAVVVKFPAVLEHDMAQAVSAIVQAATLGGFDPAGTIDLKTFSKMLASEIGVDDPEEMFARMYPQYQDQVGDGTGQPEDDPATPGAAAQKQPGAKIPQPSFSRETAVMARQLAQHLQERFAINGKR